MSPVATSFSESVYDAWLASACMPPDLTRFLLDLYEKPAVCHQAFLRGDEKIRQAVPARFMGILEKNREDTFLNRMQEIMKRHSISVLRYTDSDYPRSLADIDQSPPILFWQGSLHCLENRMLAMVGSRAASYTGQKAAGKLARDLSRKGISIVSGMACGIDTSSHQGCIEGGSPTVAVTACGLDTVYPRDNIKLRDGILENGGLILTEYAPGEKPAGWHFPFRNRIIAGLGKALVLVEARIRSGSMTTVQHTLDQGKDVFVYPGDPDSDQFEGNHRLLREGGIYFTSAEDILRDLNWLDNPSPVRQNSQCYDDTAALTPEQAAVVRALKPGKLSFEQIAEVTGLAAPALMGALTILQISGRIETRPGKIYQLKNPINPEE